MRVPRRFNHLSFYRKGALRLLIFHVVLKAGPLTAQRLPVSEAITIEDGLGFRDVTSIAQDISGLMWFGTRQGLNRYDGYRFLKLGPDPLTDIKFPGEFINYGSSCFLDDSTICLIADKRLLAININTFSSRDLGSENGITGQVGQLKKSPDQSLWVVWEDEKDQYLWRIEKQKTGKIIAKVTRGRREFTSLAIDTIGNVWWSSVTGGLKQYDPQGYLMHEAKPDSFIWYGTKMYFTPVFIDRQNRIFLFPKSKHDLWQYSPSDQRIELIASELPSLIYYAGEDQLGNVWFAGRVHLYRYDADHQWTDFTKTLSDVLSYSRIQSIFEDRTNLMWIATDNGLVKFPNQKQVFENRFDVKESDWGNVMRGIFSDHQGRIYSYCEIGQVGLHRYDPGTGKSDIRIIPAPGQPDPNLLSGASYLITDPKDNAVWLLSERLMKLDLETLKPTISVSLENDPRKYPHNPFFRLQNGQFILGSTTAHLMRYDPVTNQKSTFTLQHNTAPQFSETECFEDGPDNSIWVGTSNQGLYRIDQEGKVLDYYSKSTKPSLSNDHILSLFAEGDSLLWIGTFGGGLNLVRLKQNQVIIFTQKEGLANDNVTAILPDDQGNIWISTYNGLSCYLRKEGLFRNFFQEDGLTNNEFNYSSAYRDPRGMLWFGGMNGIQSFNPEDAIHQQVNPPLAFTGFMSYNRQKDSLSVQVWGDDHIDEVLVSPYDSYIQFTWTLPNYFKPEQSTYFVWLEGLEDDWTNIGHVPVIRYHKLPAGHYVLHIKGLDSKGNPSDGELTIPIRVKEFFFKTAWFALLVMVFLGSLVFALIRYRYQKLLEMERMRTRIAGDLHDEVGSMLSGLAMQAEIMELSHQKSDPARLHRISEISRMTLSKMRDVVWSIDSRRDSVKDLLDRMRENAAEMFGPRETEFHFELGELPLEKKLPVDVRQHLFLFYKEAINNIVKHSRATEVNIRFGQFGDIFEMSIRDNGAPIATTSSSTGFGLQNLEMRAKKLGGTFLLNKSDGFIVGIRMRSL